MQKISDPLIFKYFTLVLFALLLVITYCWAFDNGKNADTIETFVRNTYLHHDKIYTARPTNRFQAARKYSEISLTSQENTTDISSEILFLDDGFFNVRILKDGKLLSQKIDPFNELKGSKLNLKKYIKHLLYPENIRKKIFFTELLKTQYGTFLFYRLNQLNSLSNNLSIDDFTNKERDFVEGFICVSKSNVFGPEFQIQKIDPEKKYSRQLWDIFRLHEQIYVLIFNRVYESYEFEIYTLKVNGMKLEHYFQFGGL